MRILLKYSILVLTVLAVTISVKGLVKHNIMSSENEVECEADKITVNGQQLSIQKKYIPFFYQKVSPFHFSSFPSYKVAVPSFFAEETPLFIQHCSWLI
jgi:hypothetical protein